MSLSFLKSTCSSLTFLFIFLLTSRSASGQLFLIGTDPGKVKWNQLKTPNFKVIYPRHLEGKGQYIASGLEYNYLPGSRTLNTLAPRTPVIIHPYTTVPSSVTYIAPRRMEFFTTPPQDIYPQDWINSKDLFSMNRIGFFLKISFKWAEVASLMALSYSCSVVK